ncbi:hypothetical protein B0J12DRAFT_151268 [Macrophomina phaseolina]|uniref:Uncharacterized protein n=1 Tax=Macrophomina phaseolina TaxID=35725 RepID=A0ABQ8G4Y3_9PEZI|nr:hypothetical protein B0J12DRAFT_151268 [Macrophomina phaseolina]
MDDKSNYPRAPQVSFGKAVAIGLGAGAIGALSMVASSKVEQLLLTNRPNSYVPATTSSRLLGVSSGASSRHPDALNHFHHFSMALLTAPVRAVMSYYGVIGPIASLMFLPLRIAVDQVFEIGAGASALPWTWPINEQWVDVVHKAVFAFGVGYLTDLWVRGVNWFNV